ncbi:MAG: hydrogenase maturation protease [Gammaproteobacteria bacterium]|nr:hydrogenase maturation protease [Gammaproteobacteria bacterium]
MNKLLIFGYGNPARGDDALGPLLAEHIESIQARQQWQHVDVLSAYQLQIENVMDIAAYQITVFVDAHRSCSRPYCFDRCLPEVGQSYTSHALTPDALLAVYQQTYKQQPPPCYLLSIRGEQFELGQALSAAAQHNLQMASAFAEQLCVQSITRSEFDASDSNNVAKAYA